MIVAGVFERHPTLKVIGAEGGINYTAIMEQRLDSGYRGFWGKLDHGLSMRPSEYFRRNVFLTYINDEIGLNNLRFTGADHFMWSGDYPTAHRRGRARSSRIQRRRARPASTRRRSNGSPSRRPPELYHIDLDVVSEPSPAIRDLLPAGADS